MKFNPKLCPRIITAVLHSNYRHYCRKLCFFQGSTAPAKKRASRGSQSKRTLQVDKICENGLQLGYMKILNHISLGIFASELKE